MAREYNVMLEPIVDRLEIEVMRLTKKHVLEMEDISKVETQK